MDGISKVIDELGLIILSKDIEIESQKEEIDKLRKKIEVIEQYLDMYDKACERELHN